MKSLSKYLILFLLSVTTLEAKGPFLFSEEDEQHVFINNRILARVNDKAISVMDIMKQMDMMFYKQFPQYTSFASARFQYYQANWRHVLDDLIDKELIVADAIEHKLPVTSGDIRQEMEMIFGPNIIANLDKINLSFNEAWEMVKNDIIIRRMIYLMANAKAQKKVTPKDVKNAYEAYTKENILPEEWQYQVLSIRATNATTGGQIADSAYQLLSNKQCDLNEIVEKLKQMSSDDSIKITLSELYKHGEKDLSEVYKEALTSLSTHSYSLPKQQTSRADKSTVYRIFFLKEYRPEGPPSLKDVEKTLQEKLLNEAIDQATGAYLKKLRQHYHLQKQDLEFLSNGFQPFMLK
jgi:hypothetical protein